MRFELKQLESCEAFNPCRFYTPLYTKEIEGLSLTHILPPDRWVPNTLLIICGTLVPEDDEVLERWLKEIKLHGIAGVLVDPGSIHKHDSKRIRALCIQLQLVFGTVPLEYVPSMFQKFEHLFASQTDGKIETIDMVLNSLQQSFCIGGVTALLDELSYWTGCQAALIIGQDTFVRPPSPILEEAVFYPAFWHKLPLKSALPHLSLYAAIQSEMRMLQCDLYKKGLPFGTLCLISPEPDFDLSVDLLLNYASLLCSGIDDLKQRSLQIKDVIHRLSNGSKPTEEDLLLLPDEGYALVMVSSDDQQLSPSKKGYLSYLLHHHFSQKIAYCFSDNGGIQLFASTEDVEHFAEKLLAVFDNAGKHYRAGISRHYESAQAGAAFYEAESAAQISRLMEQKDRLCHYHDLGIYRLLNYPDNSWPANQMLGDMDVLLNQMSPEKRDMLSLTIRMFVKCNFNYQKTADHLYTHVNTVRYRIKLIEDLWDVDLASDDGRLLFSILAKLLPLWMKSGDYSGTIPEELEIFDD